MMEFLDLPLIWAGVIAIAVFLYVFLDGFDLGIGILFAFARKDDDRDVMMNSIAPVWDGNETWLVLGGGGLFAAFPLAYSILMPAFYMPIGFMLTGLIFRGVAFEFRLKATGAMRKLWEQAFHFGSFAAAFSQGMILGTFVQGITVVDNQFAGTMFDWLTPFSLVTGFAVVWGYALLGATWLIVKADGELEDWARSAALITGAVVAGSMVLVSIWMLFLDTSVPARWGLDLPNIDWGRLMLHAPIPIIAAACLYKLARSIRDGSTYWPFLCSIGLFALGYLGLGLSIFPAIVPFHITIWEAAAAPSSQGLLLIGVAIFLPIILAYTGYAYWVFRGKVKVGEGYH
jgi:cytochrome bd ubiquinol oxidase subunit II